jgi:DNA repair protein RecN (Recombination protein N)
MGGIRSAALDFGGDFIAITGESGAGKSSLVRAFEFISGKRSNSSFINAACEEAEVTALWSDGEEQIVTRRILSRAGRGRCWIGEGIATVGTLAAYADKRLGIQSQFAQLNLLDGARQLELVDQCGGEELRSARDALAEIFPMMIDAEREISGIKRRRAEAEARLEGAPERVRRIRALGITPGCEEIWERERAALEQAEAEAGKYENILYRMGGGETEVDLLEQITALLREIYSVAPAESAAEWRELGEDGLSKLGELFDAAKRELGMMSREDIENALEKCEARQGALRRLKRETGATDAMDLIAYIAETESEAKWFAESGSSLEGMMAEASRLRVEAAAAAKKLRASREQAAADFGRRVNSHLSGLGMEDARFSVVVNKTDRVKATGAESVSFMLSQNQSEPEPAARVASGGELSRILIAIQASIEPGRLPEALVFDEVEAGLGGRTALLAGEKLRELSRGRRTVLITHEATIAAMADQHFVVTRNGDDTEVREITGEAREREIARMLAGSESREAMEHARALLGPRRAT